MQGKTPEMLFWGESLAAVLGKAGCSAWVVSCSPMACLAAGGSGTFRVLPGSVRMPWHGV